jgi:hypothetical protein
VGGLGGGGWVVLKVRDWWGVGGGGGGFLRGVLRFRHSRGGWILKGGWNYRISPGSSKNSEVEGRSTLISFKDLMSDSQK